MCVKCQNVYIIQVNAEIRCLWENIFCKRLGFNGSFNRFNGSFKEDLMDLKGSHLMLYCLNLTFMFTQIQ